MIQLNERQIYDLEWLEDCYKKVRFPNPKCEDFLTEINKTLSNKIRGELDNKVKQQALFSLLGEDYVRIHFPHHKYDLSVLDPPKTRPEVRKAYVEEMKQLVQEQLGVTLKECGYPEDVSLYNPEKEDQLTQFLNEVSKVFKDELVIQMNLAKKADRIQNIEMDSVTAAGSRVSSRRSSIQSLSESIMSFVDLKRRRSSVKSMGLRLVEVEEFQASQIPGEAFVAAAKHNDQVSKTALRIFKDKALMFPTPMRQFLWEDFIYTGTGQNAKKPKSLQRQRKEFKELVQKKLPPGKMNRSVQSPDVNIIYSVLIDSYETTKTLKPIAEDDHMLIAAHVINVINVTDKYYSNAQIFWLLPFQLVYEQEDHEQQEDYIIRLSNHLQIFSKYCALSWKDVHAVAADILDTVKTQDPEYFNHLKSALGEKILPIDVYDFAYEILHKDPKKSTKIWKDLYKNKKKKDWSSRDLEIFGNLAIYLRKWVSECFAGIYGGQTLLFLWDNCFMHGWSKKIFYKIGLVTIMLIKPWAMMADNHRKMSTVLMNEPSDLYINDLRTALMKFKDLENDVKQIADLNTNIQFEYVEEEPASPKNDGSDHDEPADQDPVSDQPDQEQLENPENDENAPTLDKPDEAQDDLDNQENDENDVEMKEE